MIKKILKTKIITLILSNKWISKKILKNSTIILVYHGVSKNPPMFHKIFNLNIEPKLFEKQIIWIKKNFNIISPQDIVENNYKKPAAMITFDDGDRSYLKHASPILKKHNISSIIFLNMEVIKGNISWAGLVTYLANMNKEFKDYYIKKNSKINDQSFLRFKKNMIESFLKKRNKSKIYKDIRKYSGNFLSLNDIKKLDKNRLVFFGNHLYNHYNAINISDETLKTQYIKNQKEIDKFNNSTELFAYPFGQIKTCYNSKTNKTIKKLGAKLIFSSNPLSFKRDDKFFHRMPMHSKFISNNILISHLVLLKIKQFFMRN